MYLPVGVVQMARSTQIRTANSPDAEAHPNGVIPGAGQVDEFVESIIISETFEQLVRIPVARKRLRLLGPGGDRVSERQIRATGVFAGGDGGDPDYGCG